VIDWYFEKEVNLICNFNADDMNFTNATKQSMHFGKFVRDRPNVPASQYRNNYNYEAVMIAADVLNEIKGKHK